MDASKRCHHMATGDASVTYTQPTMSNNTGKEGKKILIVIIKQYNITSK